MFESKTRQPSLHSFPRHYIIIGRYLTKPWIFRKTNIYRLQFLISSQPKRNPSFPIFIRDRKKVRKIHFFYALSFWHEVDRKIDAKFSIDYIEAHYKPVMQRWTPLNWILNYDFQKKKKLMNSGAMLLIRIKLTLASFVYGKH